MPLRGIYRLDPKKWSTAESQRRRARSPRVSPEELERLRLPENRLEALVYSPGKKQLVCLNCGRIFAGNFSRHPSACEAKPQSADSYREQWGYNRSNPLTSAEWQTQKSQSLKSSPKFKAAKAKNQRTMVAAFSGERRRHSTVGRPIRRGPQRLQTVLGKRGRRLPARPDRQKVPDSKIMEIIALDLPIAQSAKLAIFNDGGRRRPLSQTAYYRRAQSLGWNAEAVRSRRRVVNRLVFELRSWLRAQHVLPTVQDIGARYAKELRGDRADLFSEFTPYLPHLQNELRMHPGMISELASRTTTKRGGDNSGAVIKVASKVFQQTRARHKFGEGAATATTESHAASEREIEKGRRCHQIITEMRHIKRVCVDSGRTISEAQSTNPEYEVWKLREALSEEDRETFNHPRRWGPVVGYSRLVLAKDYDRNEGTVKNWVKSFRRWRRSQPSGRVVQ